MAIGHGVCAAIFTQTRFAVIVKEREREKGTYFQVA